LKKSSINKYKRPIKDDITISMVSKPSYETVSYGLLYPEAPKDSMDLNQFLDD